MADTKRRSPRPKGQIVVQRRPTAVLRKQSFIVKVVAANGETLMTSEKYSRHIDALSAANQVGGGGFVVVDEAAQ